MTGAIIILAVTLAIGLILWAWEKARGDRPLHHHHHAAPAADTAGNSGATATPETPAATEPDSPPAICCGLHAICEKTGQVNEPPVYYDDEELDRFAHREPDDYSDPEIEEFRDVLLTLLPADAPGWAVSLERRHINLPAPLRPELELLLAEA
ncbi:MAG: hypothetical protein Q4C37_08880 [Bacteroidales bacterium]|nr:hypothetical protein [Bacteroidales bacterium]